MEEKKKSKKAILIVTISLVTLLIVILCAVGGYFGYKYLAGNKSVGTDWGDIYYAYLQENISNDSFKDVENGKIKFVQLAKNETPAMILTCDSPVGKLLNIFTIDDSGEVKTKVDSASEGGDVSLDFLYNIESNEYNWYVHIESEDNLETYTEVTQEYLEGKSSDDEKKYDFTDDKKKNEVFVDPEIEDNETDVDLNYGMNKKELKEKVEQAVTDYKSQDETLTDEVKEKVENSLPKYEKVDSSKDIVYTGDEYTLSQSPYTYHYKYPVININSDDVKKVNEEIKKDYGFNRSEIDDDFGYFYECEVMDYSYYVNDNILSVVPIKGGNESTFSKSYNIDLKTGKLIDNATLLDGVNLDEAKQKLNAVAEKVVNESYSKYNTVQGEYSWMDDYIKKWAEKRKQDLENLTNVYLNKDGDVCIRLDFDALGGQETCWKVAEVNATKMTDAVEINYEDYMK